VNAPVPRVLRRAVIVVLAFTVLSPSTEGLAQATGEAVILSAYRSRVGVNKLPRTLPHAGVDFADKLGAPVLAAADGTVEKLINYDFGCGTGVVLAHRAFKRYTVYCHLQRSLVRVGQTVARGETIGQVGTSGNAFGVPHLHFEVCTSACSSHVDGDLWGTRNPLRVTDGCFDAKRTDRSDRFRITFPIQCTWWAAELYR
jgi:murein DD-endopeptidase MepM/ murein hydrolase activator NlpD